MAGIKNQNKNLFGFALSTGIEKGGKKRNIGALLSKAESWGPSVRKQNQDSPLSAWRIATIYIVIFAALIVVFGRSFDLQIIKGALFFGDSQGNRLRTIVHHAPRGAIFDRNGKVLAENTPGYRLSVDKDLVSENKREKLLEDLSSILGESLSQKEVFDSEENPVTLKTNLESKKAILIEAKEASLPGVVLEASPVRFYPHKEILSHLIGYTSEADEKDIKKESTIPYSLGDQVGKFGIEQSLESSLRGVNGYKLISTDASGEKTGEVFDVKSIAGKNIALSMDLDLQKVLFEELQKSLIASGARAGSAVAIDPNTGQILAIVSLPSFDNNLFAQGISARDYQSLIESPDKNLLNRAISASYPPGSTFKMISSVAGLETGTIKPETKIEDRGFVTLGGIVFNNWLWTDHKKTEGAINVVRALARSTDTFYYELGMRMGEKPIQDWASRFGFGKKTGVELPGEQDGLVPTNDWKQKTKGEPWYPGETLNISIGQGDLLTTPLQISLATAVFANGGKLLTPTLLKESPTKIVKENFLKKQTLETVREGLYHNTIGDGNVAWLFSSLTTPSAGKTGTAETGNGAPHAWYTGFAPYTNPKIVITVQVEEVGHGSEIAAPVVKETFNWYFANR